MLMNLGIILSVMRNPFFFKTRKKAMKGNTEINEFEVIGFVKIVEGIES